MANEKNPSIYYDRGTIGSSEELDEYGVWIKSEPQDLSPVNTDARQTIGPEDAFSPKPAGNVPDGDLPDFDEFGTESWLSEISTDMTDLADSNITSSDGSDSPDDFTLRGDDLAFTSGAGEEEDGETELLQVDGGTENQAPAEDAIFFGEDDLSGIPMDDFLIEPPETGDPELPPQVSEEKAGQGDISTRLLMKIAQELSSIKNELSGLKQELHQIKNQEPGPAEQGGNGGFFDEEDDERIALTGDELDNIFNTADFAEETGADVPEEVPDAGYGSLSARDSETPEGAGVFPGFSETSAGTGADSLARSSESAEISPELEQLREEGVEPMTPAPEDTSFLEEDPAILDLPEDDSFGSSFDFDDAVIEEPDLSGELKENPLEEPSLEDFPLELDMEVPSGEDETADLSGGDGDIEELELSLDDAGIPDGFVSGELSADFSPEDDVLGAGISFGNPGDIPSAGEPRDGDAYDQVIPEGFLVESEDSPVREEIFENDELLESAGDPLALEDILEIEDIPEDVSAGAGPDIPAGEEDVPAADAAFEEENTGRNPPGILPPSGAKTPGEPVPAEKAADVPGIPSDIKNELRSVLSYMDQLLESLPEEKIEEFAKSEHFEAYKKLFEELGLA
jgi:hypothetical protein